MHDASTVEQPLDAVDVALRVAAAGSGPEPEPGANPRVRLAYLDGLRALAATYVVAFHAVIGFYSQELSGPWRVLRRPFAFGHEAVAVFIVLSGYCLMLPRFQGRTPQLEVKFGQFIRRRATRILPPYYAALAGSLLLMATVPVLRARSGTIWDDSMHGLDVGAIASHLLLIHNWTPEWAFQINGPLWSVATEWQIYFCFPLLLLPIWKRFGMLACIGSAVTVGYAPLSFAREAANLAIPWYLVLFTFGMGAASLGFSSERRAQALAKAPWSWISAIAWSVCLLFGTAAGRIWFSHKPFTDVLFGFAMAALLVSLTSRSVSGKPSRLLKLLESAPVVSVGHFSYSLYLTHLPVLALCFPAVRSLGWPAPLSAAALLVFGGTTSFVVGWIFHVLVERRFMRMPARVEAS